MKLDEDFEFVQKKIQSFIFLEPPITIGKSTNYFMALVTSI